MVNHCENKKDPAHFVKSNGNMKSNEEKRSLGQLGTIKRMRSGLESWVAVPSLWWNEEPK
jgi:hypothetical protein